MAEVTGLPSFSQYSLFGTQPRNAADDLVKSYLKNAQDQINKQQKAIASVFDVEISDSQREVQKWMPVTSSIADAQASLNAGMTKLQQIQKVVAKMLNKVRVVDDGSTDWASVSAQFDSLRTTITSIANGGGGDNLVGSIRRGDTYAANKVTYQSGPNGEQSTIQGVYAGTDFDIHLSDGTFFRPSGAQTMQRYDAYPLGTNGYMQSVSNGAVSLDSTPYSDGSVDFTIGKHIATPSSYTGATVERRGLGILQSWMYEGLSTTDGRQRAIDDLLKAKNKLNIMTSTLQMQQTVLGNSQSRAQTEIDTAQTKIKGLQDSAQSVLQTYVANAQQEAQSNAAATAMAMNSPAVQLLQTGGRIGTLFDLIS